MKKKTKILQWNAKKTKKARKTKTKKIPQKDPPPTKQQKKKKIEIKKIKKLINMTKINCQINLKKSL